MSDGQDVIPVATNGHHPPLEPSDAGAAPTPPTATASPAAPASPAASGRGSDRSAEYSVAFTPGQVAVGFGILAGLALLVLGRRRRHRGG